MASRIASPSRRRFGMRQSFTSSGSIFAFAACASEESR
jgi:hypothetical protein